jgi:hypothetical protein
MSGVRTRAWASVLLDTQKTGDYSQKVMHVARRVAGWYWYSQRRWAAAAFERWPWRTSAAYGFICGIWMFGLGLIWTPVANALALAVIMSIFWSIAFRSVFGPELARRRSPVER